MEGPVTDPPLISEQPPVVDPVISQEDTPPSQTQTPTVSDNTNHSENEPKRESIEEPPRSETEIITITPLGLAFEGTETANEVQIVTESVKDVTLNERTNVKSTEEENEQPPTSTISTDVGQESQPAPPLTAETVPLVCVVCGTTLELVRYIYQQEDTQPKMRVHDTQMIHDTNCQNLSLTSVFGITSLHTRLLRGNAS